MLIGIVWDELTLPPRKGAGIKFMKKRISRFLTIAAATLILAVAAFAAPVDGTWTGSLATPNGDFPQVFKLKADGAKLTGTMAGLDGADIQITDGKIDGAKVSFSVKLSFSGNDIVLNYNGVVADDKITFAGEAMGQAFEVVVTKAK